MNFKKYQEKGQLKVPRIPISSVHKLTEVEEENYDDSKFEPEIKMSPKDAVIDDRDDGDEGENISKKTED